MATQKEGSIIVENANLGGIADSIYTGVKNSLASIVGFDLHSIPGVLLVNQKFTKEAGSAPTDQLYKIVPCSDGNIYLFGKTDGKVYKNAAGTYTLLGTVVPGVGSAGILDAIEYNGFLYYAMQNKLGQWNFANAFSTRNDTFGAFTNGSTTAHPIFFLANTQFIFIGDGNVIAQVSNSNVFTAGGLTTIAKNLQVDCLGSQGSDLLIGASSTSQVARSYVLRWNTWSPIPTTSYPINEAGINAFFPSEDEVIVQAGLSGNLYHLNGALFEIIKQVPPIFPNTYSPTNKVTVFYPAVANKQGIPIFGVSNVAGNVALQGVYSWGRRNIGYPKILSLEFPVSTNHLAGITIWSLAVSGNDIYCSSFDSAGGGTYQIDKLDWSNKYSGAYFETLIIRATRVWLENFDRFVTNLAQALPASTTVTVSYRINGGSYVAFSSLENFSDTIRNQFAADQRVDARTLQVKVATTASANTAPVIEDLVILVK
jgi:hypothetical protein